MQLCYGFAKPKQCKIYGRLYEQLTVTTKRGSLHSSRVKPHIEQSWKNFLGCKKSTFLLRHWWRSSMQDLPNIVQTESFVCFWTVFSKWLLESNHIKQSYYCNHSCFNTITISLALNNFLVGEVYLRYCL